MRARPIDLMALGAPMEFVMVVENKVRDFSFDFLPSDIGKERITKKTTGEKSVLIEGNDSSFE
jgi:hypothetical protein